MRTLKKTLCMVLALVMMLGLCAFGTSAAFSDADKVTYKEAVDVLTGIGVIKGMGDAANTFNPNGTLTRAQACTIITKLMGGDGITAKSTFTDMEGAAWAESYVAFCQAKGIVGGYGDGRFGPNDTLTGSQWGRMLLLAAGFDAKENGFESGNANWEIGVAKTVKDQKLAKNITGFNGTQSISRDAACEMAFQAMQVSVSGQKVYTVSTLPGQEFDSWLEAFIASGNQATNVGSTTPSDSLMSTNFPKLSEDSTATDAAGRPATKWYLDGEVIAVSTAAAAYTTTAYVPAANLNKALKNAKLKDGANDYAYTDGQGGTNPTKNGVKVEWFSNGTVVTTDADIATVSSITSTAATKTRGAFTTYNLDNGQAYKVFTSVVNKETDLDQAVIEGSIAKNDKVLIVKSDNGQAGNAKKESLPTLKVADTVSGALSGVSSFGVMTLGGKSYVKSGTTAAASFVPSAQTIDKDKEVSYYVDEYGYIIDAVNPNVAPDPYGMLLSVKHAVALSGDALVHTWTAQIADVDGNISSYLLAESEDTNDAPTVPANLPAIVTIGQSADPETPDWYVLTEKTDKTITAAYTAKDKKVTIGSVGNTSDILVGSGTKFIYANYTKKGNGFVLDGTVSVLPLSSNKGFSENQAYCIPSVTNANVASVVFVTGRAIEATVEDNYVYVLGTYNKTGTNAFVMDVIIKGEVTTITTAQAVAAGFYKAVSSDGTTAAAGAETGKILKNIAGYLAVGTTAQNVTADTTVTCSEDAPVYVINLETVNGIVDVSAGATLKFGDITTLGDANDSVYVVKSSDNKSVVAIYVLMNLDAVPAAPGA